jgi:VCBS repeat-containing protein
MALLALIAAPASAHDVYLVAKEFTNAAGVTMWGFAEDPDGFGVGAAEGAATSPGPVIRVLAGDTTLNIHVRNDLVGDDVSLFIPGQSKTLAPVFVVDGQGRERVQSFDAVTAAGGGINTYTWTDVKPGSYIYQSGSDIRTQVPMGLYGALIVESGVAYDNEAILFFSEVDPAVNNAIPPAQAGPDYKPQYFMVNGASFPAAAPIWTGDALEGQTVLLRFFNIGLDDAMPMVNGMLMNVIAEDGNPLPAAGMPDAPGQYSVLLPAGKTIDAVVTGMPGGRHAIFDRSLRLDNGAGVPDDGGQLVYLDVNSAPVAGDDAFATDEDTPLSEPAPGVLVNDSDADLDPLTAVLETDVTNGILTLNADGSFTYTPNPDFNGVDSFTYRANDGLQDGNIATVTITVNPVNDPPVAVDDGYAVDQDAVLNVAAPGVLGNDSDVEGDPLTAVLNTDVASGTLILNADGSFDYTPNPGFNGPDGFTYYANDGTADSAVAATVSITVAPPAP